YRQASTKTDAALDELESLVHDQTVELEHITHARASLSEWRNLTEKEMRKRLTSSEAPSATNARADALMDTIRHEFSTLVSAERERRTSYIESSREANRFTSRLGILLTLS